MVTGTCRAPGVCLARDVLSLSLSQSEWQCLVLVSGSFWCQVVEQSAATSPARTLVPGMSPDCHPALGAGLWGCKRLEVGTGRVGGMK